MGCDYNIEALFRSFNLGYWLDRERDKASKRQRNQTPTEEAIGRMELAIKAGEAKARKLTTQSKPPAPKVAVKPGEPLSVIAQLRGMLKGTGPP